MSSRQVGVPAVPGQGPPVWEIPSSIAAFPWQEHREEQNQEFLDLLVLLFSSLEADLFFFFTLILISSTNFSKFFFFFLVYQFIDFKVDAFPRSFK